MNHSPLFKTSLLTLLFCVTAVNAEESEPFFEKDFARSPGREQHAPNQIPEQQTAPSAPATEPSPPVSTGDPIKDRVKAALESARRAPSGQVQPPSAPGRQMTVAVVGGVLASNPHDEMVRQLEDMLSVLEKSKMLIATVYIVGQRREIPSIIAYRLGKKRGRVVFTDELPAKYRAIQNSPAWILTSLDQEIIIEAAGPLSENLRTDGTITAKAPRVPAPSAGTPATATTR